MNPIPVITSPEDDALFQQKSRAMGYDPASVWVGGYVDYQWRKLPPFLAAYGIEAAGKDVLEFGSNVGGSAIVFACLGANVTAVDVSADWIALSLMNARRYGFPLVEGGTPLPPTYQDAAPTAQRPPFSTASLKFLHVPDTRRLPFPDDAFDLINCASVLECVPCFMLADVQRELDRVLKPGGVVVVTGTSNRLWPREVHSRSWWVNYVPRFLDRFRSRSWDRGVWPWTIRYGFGPGYRNLDAGNRGRRFLAARAGVPGGMNRRLAVIAAGVPGIGPGMLAHSLSCVLRKG